MPPTTASHRLSLRAAVILGGTLAVLPAPDALAVATDRAVVAADTVTAARECDFALVTTTGTDGVAEIDGFAVIDKPPNRSERRIRIAAAGLHWELEGELAEIVPIVHEISRCNAAGTAELRTGVAYVKSRNPADRTDPAEMVTGRTAILGFMRSGRLRLAELAGSDTVLETLRTSGVEDPERTLTLLSQVIEDVGRLPREQRLDALALVAAAERESLGARAKTVVAELEAGGRDGDGVRMAGAGAGARRSAVALAVEVVDLLLDAATEAEDAKAAAERADGDGAVNAGLRDDDPGAVDESSIGRILRRFLYPIIVGEDTGTAAPGTEVILVADERRGGGAFVRVEHHAFLHTSNRPDGDEPKTTIVGWGRHDDPGKRAPKEWDLEVGELITLNFVEAPGHGPGTRRKLIVKGDPEPVPLKDIGPDDPRWCGIVAALRLGHRRFGGDLQGITPEVLGADLHDAVTRDTPPEECRRDDEEN